ncbi:MAG: hypothetical protein HND42_06070 [Armatimonadetes bacterium]|nr:hypothetical protein [Armatimonadota bacterium]NOG92793.1 hypothetical protein [Armatimonadota bacterium]
MPRFLVSGFGPFGRIEVNPSEAIVRRLNDFESVVLPVSYRAVDDFVSDCGLKSGDRWLMLGVCANCDRLRIERFARNVLSDQPDVEGEVRGKRKIDESLPKKVRGALFYRMRLPKGPFVNSESAGDYLCNFLYFAGATRLRGVRVGFLHVPTFETIAESEQLAAVSSLASKLKST